MPWRWLPGSIDTCGVHRNVLNPNSHLWSDFWRLTNGNLLRAITVTQEWLRGTMASHQQLKLLASHPSDSSIFLGPATACLRTTVRPVLEGQYQVKSL